MQYVQNLALHSGEIDERHEGDEKVADLGKVTLSTIHSCKGTVFFAGKLKARCMTLCSFSWR